MNNVAESIVIIEPKKGLFQFDFKGIWQHRELLYFLVWRDLKVRYKQTIIGIGWAVLQPLISMIIFTLIFGKLAKIPSDGLPYSIFVYSALLPWNYFASALQRCPSSPMERAVDRASPSTTSRSRSSLTHEASPPSANALFPRSPFRRA